MAQRRCCSSLHCSPMPFAPAGIPAFEAWHRGGWRRLRGRRSSSGGGTSTSTSSGTNSGARRVAAEHPAAAPRHRGAAGGHRRGGGHCERAAGGGRRAHRHTPAGPDYALLPGNRTGHLAPGDDLSRIGCTLAAPKARPCCTLPAAAALPALPHPASCVACIFLHASPLPFAAPPNCISCLPPGAQARKCGLADGGSARGWHGSGQRSRVQYGGARAPRGARDGLLPWHAVPRPQDAGHGPVAAVSFLLMHEPQLSAGPWPPDPLA